MFRVIRYKLFTEYCLFYQINKGTSEISIFVHAIIYAFISYRSIEI